ncbi:uncharacterized protein LOC124426781 isoform X1 [Vespa crabro]|uniref:uncharacterized protein LOC124426781 isoform X1 n=1 Tax=Vespa crabro TaxID=7445 RepID=UPI001F002431|nr:uncharacterized protein LOC124426781 isoform X1 [Vespa crabro]
MKAEGGGEVWNGSGGAGDEGGGHIFQLTRLQQHANSDTSFSRQVADCKHPVPDANPCTATTKTKTKTTTTTVGCGGHRRRRHAPLHIRAFLFRPFTYSSILSSAMQNDTHKFNR